MIAIIIPYYKLTFFEETLQSLAKQTDKRFKVYIGDDASLENPTELLEKYAGKFNFEYHRFETNLGGTSLTKQWERCIALSKGDEWLMVLGDDDVLEKNVIESWYNHYEVFYKKSNVIRFASKLVFEKNNEISDTYFHPRLEMATDSFYRKFKRTSRSSLSEHIFSRESYLKYGFYNYPLAWNSDDRAWLEFSDNKPIYTINQSIVYVRMSAINITGLRDNLAIKNKSEVEFYKFLISKKMYFYNSKQRLEIVKKYGKEIQRTRRLKILEWVFIVYHCTKFFNLNFLQKGVSMLFNRFNKVKWF